MNKQEIMTAIRPLAVALTARRVTDPADRRCGSLIPGTVAVVPAHRARWGDGWVVLRPASGVTWGRVARIARRARRGDWGAWNRAAAGDWSV
jgi:hypothetical protein